MKPAREHSHQRRTKLPTDPEVIPSDQPRRDPSPDVVFNRDTLGRLRKELMWTLGSERTHGVMARWGVGCGLTETLRTPAPPSTINGLGHAIDKSRADSKDEYVYDVHNSIEAAETMRCSQGASKTPQCWLMAGYLTGHISGQTGQSILFLETRCAAKGDATCRFVGRPRENWPVDYEVSLQTYEEDNLMLELSQTREQLKLTKDRYQNLFEQASTPIFIVEPETGTCVDANLAAEDLTGYSKSELLMMNVFDLRPKREHQAIMNRMKALLSQESVPDAETILTRKDGTERVALSSCKILDYAGQKVIQSIMRDITDLKLAEQKETDLQNQLSRSERLSSIGRLAASVAHEIKNPLGAIRNAIYYIKNGVLNTSVSENDPEIKKIITLAEEEVDGAVRIIEELLDFSRVVSLIPRRTIINDVLEKLPSIIAIPDTVELVWDLDLTLPAATVDPDRMTQVFCNIAINAIQAMSERGTLTVRTRLEVAPQANPQMGTEWVLVMIEDTGGGIQPQHIKKIFEPLFTTKARGTGLGLAITNNIVEKHGGSILVTSHPEKGTCFTVRLPLHTPVKPEDNGNGN